MAAEAAGDPTARFVIDTWVTFGLYIGAVGLSLLLASRRMVQVIGLAWTVIAMECAGIVVDFYKIGRGYMTVAPIVWIAIHAMVIVSGILFLRRAR